MLRDEDNDSETVCARCGVVAEGTATTWVCSIENGERRFFCAPCSRVNIRAIEERLDSAWWPNN